VFLVAVCLGFRWNAIIMLSLCMRRSVFVLSYIQNKRTSKSDPDLKVTTFFEVEYQKQTKTKDKVTIAQKESVPNIWNGTMFGSGRITV